MNDGVLHFIPLWLQTGRAMPGPGTHYCDLCLSHTPPCCSGSILYLQAAGGKCYGKNKLGVIVDYFRKIRACSRWANSLGDRTRTHWPGIIIVFCSTYSLPRIGSFLKWPMTSLCTGGGGHANRGPFKVKSSKIFNKIIEGSLLYSRGHEV